MKELNRFRQFLAEEQTNEGFLDSIFAPEKKLQQDKFKNQSDEDDEDPIDAWDFLPPSQLDAGYAEMVGMMAKEDGIRDEPTIDSFIKGIARSEYPFFSARKVRAEYEKLKNEL